MKNHVANEINSGQLTSDPSFSDWGGGVSAKRMLLFQKRM